MKDYIALITVELHKFARQIARIHPGERRQRHDRGGLVGISGIVE